MHRDLVLGDVGALLFGFGDQIVDRFGGVGIVRAFGIERNDRHFVDGRIVGLGDGVLDEQFVQTQSGARNGEIAFAGGHVRLVLGDLHGWNGVQFKLLLVIGKGLLRKGEQALLDLLVLVGIHKVPVDILDLRDGCNDLRAKGEVGDLEILLRDVHVALVG